MFMRLRAVIPDRHLPDIGNAVSGKMGMCGWIVFHDSSSKQVVQYNAPVPHGYSRKDLDWGVSAQGKHALAQTLVGRANQVIGPIKLMMWPDERRTIFMGLASWRHLTVEPLDVS